MEALITMIANEILGPDNYQLTSSNELDQITHYIITPNPDMAGLIIGKKGKIISSLRQLLKAAGVIHQKRWSLTVETN